MQYITSQLATLVQPSSFVMLLLIGPLLSCVRFESPIVLPSPFSSSFTPRTMGAALTSRQNADVEDTDISANHAYRYPPKSGKSPVRRTGWPRLLSHIAQCTHKMAKQHSDREINNCGLVHATTTHICEPDSQPDVGRGPTNRRQLFWQSLHHGRRTLRRSAAGSVSVRGKCGPELSRQPTDGGTYRWTTSRIRLS